MTKSKSERLIFVLLWISHLNEEKNSLEVFLLFQFRLPPLEKSGADIKVELAAIRFSYLDQFINQFIFNWLQSRLSFIDSGCMSCRLSTISTISPEPIRLSEISVPQTNSCIEWEFPQQQIIHPPNSFSLDLFHLNPFIQIARFLSRQIFVHPQ